MTTSTFPKKAVFLDRDGVLTRAIVREGKPFAARTLGEFEILPGTLEALRKLKDHGYLLVVVTNQPDIATGKVSADLVNEMHRLMGAALPIDAFEVCAHVDADNCACRKPKPGMITQSAKRLGISLSESYMVGDRWRDTEAGSAAGCKTIWIKTDYLEKKPGKFDFVAADLGEAADWIIKQPF